MKEIPLILFAKAPIPGRVKTRLQSHCNPEQAAHIAEILLEASIQTATQYWPGPVYLSIWLDSEHSFIQDMLAQYPITLTTQCEGDLGEKMHHAMQEFGYPAAILGCDAPHILNSDLQIAYDTLPAAQAVIGPSLDGGYYFIALDQDRPEIFQGISWGQETVLAKTLKKARFEFIQLQSLNDVDEWPDVVEVAEKLPALKQYLDSSGLLKP